MGRFNNNRGMSVNILTATNTGNNRRTAVSMRRPRKSGRDYNLSLHTMSLMYPHNKRSLVVNSALRGGKFVGLPLPIHQPGNRKSREVCTITPKWAGTPSS
jgi:hypothetical protein